MRQMATTVKLITLLVIAAPVRGTHDYFHIQTEYLHEQSILEFEPDRRRAFSARGDRSVPCAAAVCADGMMRQIVGGACRMRPGSFVLR
jgi:hypothetical protein